MKIFVGAQSYHILYLCSTGDCPFLNLAIMCAVDIGAGRGGKLVLNGERRRGSCGQAQGLQAVRSNEPTHGRFKEGPATRTPSKVML